MEDSEPRPYAPKMAKLIRVQRVGQASRLEINGEPFPWAIPADCPITVNVENGSAPTVQLELVAERVEVVDAMSGRYLMAPTIDSGVTTVLNDGPSEIALTQRQGWEDRGEADA